MSLNLLLDNANPEIWAKCLKTGIFNGITTNPSLLRQAKQPCTIDHLKFLVEKATELNSRELHLQAWGENYIDIFNCGLSIGSLSTPQMHVYVKIPISKEGCEAAKALIKSKISITFTACFEVKQVLVASAIGASYIAPYLGRINDEGKDGKAELINMHKVLERTNSNCRILAASIRKVQEINYLATNGINTFTINEQIADALFKCDQTEKSIRQFQVDALML